MFKNIKYFHLLLALILMGGLAIALYLKAQSSVSSGGGSGSEIVMNDGSVKVELPGTVLFQDTFSYGLDVTNKWVATSGGTGTAATNVVGDTVLSSGTTLNSFSKLTTPFTFTPTSPGYLQPSTSISYEIPILTTGYRFWGLGTSIASPTIANPVTQGVGMEIGTDGHLDCVTYATGSRRLIKDLTAAGTAPNNTSSHTYIERFRGDTTTYYIDEVVPANGTFQSAPVCGWYSGASGPDVNELPLLFEAVSNGSTAVTVTVNAAIVSDYGRNSIYQADATYPWRRVVQCDKTGLVSGVGAATVQLVGVPPQGVSPTAVVKICGITFANTNLVPTNVKLVEGTGSNCGSNQAALTGNFALAAVPANFSPSLGANGSYRTMVGGDALCVTGSAAGAVDVTFTYYQGP